MRKPIDQSAWPIKTHILPRQLKIAANLSGLIPTLEFIISYHHLCLTLHSDKSSSLPSVQSKDIPLCTGMEDAWTREIDDIAREFNVNLHTGLTESQVQQNLEKYGKNGMSSLP